MDVLREDTLNWDILLNNVMINGEFISKSKHINVHAQLSCLQRISLSGNPSFFFSIKITKFNKVTKYFTEGY